jgi:predicted phosphohydrolase
MKTINELVSLLNKSQNTTTHEVWDGDGLYKQGKHRWERQEAFEEIEGESTTEAQVLFDRNYGHLALYADGEIQSSSSKAIVIGKYMAVDKEYYGTEKALFRQVD